MTPRHASEHDWLVVAPWWKWATPTDPQQGRLTGPVLQKYESSDLVNQFLKDPQRCLKFMPEDLVHKVVFGAASAKDNDGKDVELGTDSYVPDGSNTRKIFLDTHKRFYLVICQINCDGLGFPKAARNKVCEAGFVVRRRTTKLPAGSVKEARAILKALGSTRAKGSKLAQAAAKLQATGAAPLRQAKRSALESSRASVQGRFAAEQARLRDFAERFAIAPRLEGWFKSPVGLDKVGFWGEVDETPDELEGEVSFPLYPLIASPAQPDHAGQFGTIYFGMLPTSSADTTPQGEARFDSQQLYEVRCFVRRHKEPHDRGSVCPCPDDRFWSAPTDPYKLAAHFDLAGTSKRPVTVQLPDLAELKAQSKPALGTRFVKPPGSLMISGNKDSSVVKRGVSADFEICFIPIPLITIVAMFVFELFLPIVMLIFGLFWMLKLKFCIPPEISVAVDLKLELDASLSASQKTAINASIGAAFGIGSDVATELQTKYSPIALNNLAFDAKLAGEEVSASSTVGGAAGTTLPTVDAQIEWEAEVDFA